ncbi:MAG: A/G-specific adenine glycosylase [Verrucomicrobiaceae bacterium]|nr:A/G-specific adenine glycosylase [Verrucomicrobiaceae bacterium]
MAQQAKEQKVKENSPIKDVEGLRSAMISWFSRVGKEYPWRMTEDGYEILVSEMMLQQTQVATVIGRGYYHRWLEQFPDIHTLAEADEESVLRAWEGLGYYSRARNLQKAARLIVEEHGGVFPRSLSQIEALPGVGRYTAGAVASFAFDAPVAAVDANIARVLARLFDFRERVDTTHARKQLLAWACSLVPDSGGRIWNSALMELGQHVCKSGSVACHQCPAVSWCRATDPLLLPAKKKRKAQVAVDEHVLLAFRRNKLLLEQEVGRRRRGLWKLPARAIEEIPDVSPAYKEQYSITRYRVTMFIHELQDVIAQENERWFRLEEIADLPMPSPYRRVVVDFLARQGKAIESR